MRIAAILFLCALSLVGNAESKEKPLKAEKPPVSETSPQVKLQTTLGEVVIKLNAEKAPLSVKNFLSYVKEGHYDGTIFHRVIPGFMAQGGGYTEKFQQKPTHPPIKNEADNRLLNKRGTIAMARTPDPDSATAQFFINYADNGFLDYKSSTPSGWGYAVFGEVVEGMDVVDKMATIPTGRGGPMATDVPQTPIVIEKAMVVGE
jgi:peptidyl-prolyl cis-trans isomerase B (cyclophilin B)